MGISQKLSWEIATLNGRGNTGDTERLAAEIAYGVSLTQGDPGSFVSTMNAIIEQVTNRMLRLGSLCGSRRSKVEREYQIDTTI